MIDVAVIMAAGKGTRFGTMTELRPKGFIEFKGKSMIERSIDNLLAVGIKKIIIGTGYHHEWYDNLSLKYPQIKTVYSPDFATTNSMETLWQCRNEIGENDFILLESDIVYEATALTQLITNPNPDILLVTPVRKFQDQYYIWVSKDLYLSGCSTDLNFGIKMPEENPYGELVGIHKISNDFYKEMIKDYESGYSEKKTRGYEYEMEDVATAYHRARCNNLPQDTQSYKKLFVLKSNTVDWYEIDDMKDLEFAERNVRIN